jgi:hypothetical protein
VQIALKPASKTLGLHGVFKRGKGRKYLIADSAFTLQVDDPGAYWLDADEHHLGLALRTGGALDCNECNDRQAGAQHSLSPVCTETLAASSHRSNAPIKRKSPSILRKIVALTPLKLTSDPQIG